MARACDLCGKSTVSGNRIKHHHSIQWLNRAPRTKRAFKPNTFMKWVDVDGKKVKMRICAKCNKRLKKVEREAEMQVEASANKK